MAKIGTLNKQENGDFEGNIDTLLLSTKITIKPTTEKRSDKSPDYRIFKGTTDIGACWNMENDDGVAYISYAIDDPSLNNAIKGGILPDEDGSYSILWNRKPE